MCQICALSLRHSELSKQGLSQRERYLNPKPLSVLVMLNPPAQDSNPSSTSNESRRFET